MILISVSLKPTNICVIHVNFRTVKNCKSGFITVFDQVESKNDITYSAIVRAGDCQMGYFYRTVNVSCARMQRVDTISGPAQDF